MRDYMWCAALDESRKKIRRNPIHHAITSAEYRHFCHHASITCDITNDWHPHASLADQIVKSQRADDRREFTGARMTGRAEFKPGEANTDSLDASVHANLKVGGENVTAFEIERVIALAPGVHECAVVVI